MKASALSGPALDYAVIMAEGVELTEYWLELFRAPDRRHMCSRPSLDWRTGGPIVERKGICIRRGNPLYFPQGDEGGNYYEPLWLASIGAWRMFHGHTPLITAMRCYVTTKLGEDIYIPEELL